MFFSISVVIRNQNVHTVMWIKVGHSMLLTEGTSNGEAPWTQKSRIITK